MECNFQMYSRKQWHTTSQQINQNTTNPNQDKREKGHRSSGHTEGTKKVEVSPNISLITIKTNGPNFLGGRYRVSP